MGLRQGGVLIIGPGKIGCGYLAPLFLDAGWRPELIARSRKRARRIRHAGSFHVRVTTDSGESDICCGVMPFGRGKFRTAVRNADLILTAVGVENVPGLGPALARALADRPRTLPINVCVVENADVAPALERAVRREASRSSLELPPVGFAGAIAYPIVAGGDWDDEVAPTFVRDGVDRLLVDSTRLVDTLPDIPGLEETRHYQARLHEKLHVFGAGHALCAYLGARCGYERLDEAAHDPLLRNVVRTCLLDARAALEHEYPGLHGDGWEAVDRAISRYENDRLRDPIRRVARNPLRKLSPTGPVVGGAKLVRAAFGRVTAPFALGIASALLYRDDADEQARELRKMLRQQPVGDVLQRVSGLEQSDPLFRSVIIAYERMRRIPGPVRPAL